MSKVEAIRDLINGWSTAWETWRGPVPTSLLATQCYLESGGSPYSVSRDPVLIEVGLSQEPLGVAYSLDVDPFSWTGGIYMACMAGRRRWTRLAQGPLMRTAWLPYWTLLSYSLGDAAVRRILDRFGPDPQVILARPWAVGAVGRQSAVKVAWRIVRQEKRRKLAAEVGPLDEPPGIPAVPPIPRPAPLPLALRRVAARASRGEATLEDWRMVRAYAKDRARRGVS